LFKVILLTEDEDKLVSLLNYVQRQEGVFGGGEIVFTSTLY
jgi:hypothetical protein